MASCGTIVVVDHDSSTRASAMRAATQLEYEVEGGTDADVLWELLDDERPALAVIEVELPGPTNGLELMRELHERYGDELPVILVSANRTEALDRVAGLLLGADDYLVKPFDYGELVARMRRSLRRADGARPNGRGNGSDSRYVGAVELLSPREREILSLLAQGKTQKDIALLLVISPKTVGTHIQRLLSKLGVHSRTQAVAVAFRAGLVDTDVAAHVFRTAEVATPSH